eukprot:Hpha_TRINITY_DN16721_c0_g5::TRINITY_DN16721_c0_g5_i1::g.77413::m.77413
MVRSEKDLQQFRLRRLAEAASRASWMRRLKLSKEWDVQSVNHRSMLPTHFSLGEKSQFGYHRAIQKTSTKEVWAVALGTHAANGYNNAQEGAVAAVFDVVTGLAGARQVGYRAMVQRSMAVDFHRPTPCPGLVAVDVEVATREELPGGVTTLTLTAKMHDAEGTIYSECKTRLQSKKSGLMAAL